MPSFDRTIRSDGSQVKIREPAQIRHQVDITPDAVQDRGKLSRLLTLLADDVRMLVAGRRQRIDFEDIPCTSGTSVQLEHRMGCRVRWWLVDWTGAAAPNLSKDTTNTTSARLVLTCGQTGTATFRVESI